MILRNSVWNGGSKRLRSGYVCTFVDIAKLLIFSCRGFLQKDAVHGSMGASIHHSLSILQPSTADVVAAKM